MAGIRTLYQWAIKHAGNPRAQWFLFILAFIEPWLLPIPPDTMLIPMAIAQRPRAFKLAAIATVGSVLGGLVGYAVGALAMATIGKWVVETYHMQDAFDHFKHAFKHYGMWIILAKGLTPIPFILVTLASGMSQLNLGIFIVSAAITRGTRFFLEAILIHHFGEPIRIFIEKYLTWIALAVLAFIGAGFWFVLR